jgi:hypothetical protein
MAGDLLFTGDETATRDTKMAKNQITPADISARPGDRRSRRPLRPDRLAHLLDIGDIGEFASSPSTTTGSPSSGRLGDEPT